MAMKLRKSNIMDRINELRIEKFNRTESLDRLLTKQDSWTNGERELASAHTVRINAINRELHKYCAPASL